MRIAFIGHFTETGATGDMGTRAVARYLSAEMEKYHEVRRVDIRDLRAWYHLAAFRPDIIHLVLGPTTEGLLAFWLCMLPIRRPLLVISAPNLSPSLHDFAVRLCKPDLVLVQSERSERFFLSLGIPATFLPNGVDMDRFVPVPSSTRRAFRMEHDLDMDRFTLLHVGPIIQGRNLIPLAPLSEEGYQVVIVGRKPVDRETMDRLTGAGCRVITRQVEHIEKYYQLADCYLFPVPPDQLTASIETPLSVLEAMAANLPVITTRFGAIPRLFPSSGDRFVLLDHPDQLRQALESLRASTDPIRTRERVAPCSWQAIGVRLIECYEGLQGRHRIPLLGERI
jgi:glycosyltransferase involved in cell wall biosynthesis